MSGLRYVNDPLVSVSGQFPLSPAEFSAPDRSESPSGPETRPFALRWLVEIGRPSARQSHRYCPLRQMAVDIVTGEPRPPLSKLEWTTVSQKTGRKGRRRTTTGRPSRTMTMTMTER